MAEKDQKSLGHGFTKYELGVAQELVGRISQQPTTFFQKGIVPVETPKSAVNRYALLLQFRNRYNDTFHVGRRLLGASLNITVFAYYRVIAERIYYVLTPTMFAQQRARKEMVDL